MYVTKNFNGSDYFYFSKDPSNNLKFKFHNTYNNFAFYKANNLLLTVFDTFNLTTFNLKIKYGVDIQNDKFFNKFNYEQFFDFHLYKLNDLKDLVLVESFSRNYYFNFLSNSYVKLNGTYINLTELDFIHDFTITLEEKMILHLVVRILNYVINSSF